MDGMAWMSWRAASVVPVALLVGGSMVSCAGSIEQAELSSETSPSTITVIAPTNTASTSAPADTGTTSPVTSPPASSSDSTTATAPPSTRPVYDVKTASFTFTDTSRSTAAHGGSPSVPQRRLPTTVWYPSGPGSFPLVVFGPGFANSANDYRELLTEVAARGFVVAAPEFPLTSPVNTTAMVERDLSNEPADLAFVATQLQSTTLTDKLADGDFAVMGHSDGAVVALATAFDPCCTDPRVGAVVSLSGNATGFGPDAFPSGSPPLLAVHGTADTTNPYANSATLFARARSPKFLLRVLGGSHESPFTRDPIRPTIALVVADFLRGTLQDDQDSLIRMTDDSAVDGVLTLQAG